MKSTYLVLAILGFIAPNILVLMESMETGNILLYADIAATISSMFANRISTIFSIDLLVAVMVFFVWSFYDSKELNLKNTWQVWLLTMLFGLAGAFPYYLYRREQAKEVSSQ